MAREVGSRLNRAILIVSILPLSWLGMMIVHECGHVLAAWATGGTVIKVVLYPLVFSRTDVFPNPHPLAVAWAGPVFGAMAPLAAFGTAAAVRWRGAYLLRFFAGFCLIANGAYIGVGSIDRVGDTYRMLLFGSSRWQLWLFGAVTCSLGLLLWHRLGPHFGLGPRPRPIRSSAAYGTPILLVLLIAAEFLLGWR